MPIQTSLTRRLGLSHPIIQAPMGGGPTTVDLTVAACEAGALGFIAAAYLTPDAIRENAEQVRHRTSRPFGINLFIPPGPVPPFDPAKTLARMAPIHAELGLPEPTVPETWILPFEPQFEAAMESGAAVFSFTFGLLPENAVREAKARGMLVVGTATTVEEAIQLEASGVDAVVAQGSEAGAHRGTFATDFGSGLVGTIALVPQTVDAVNIPVIASGGIMDGRGIAAALMLGADAVQMGTAFLLTDEAGTTASHREAILHAREDQTQVTRAFSGRAARGIVNRFLEEFESDPEAILPYPVQNALTRAMRTEAGKRGRSEFLSLWAGQGLRMAKGEPTRELIERLARETEEALTRRSAQGR